MKIQLEQLDLLRPWPELTMKDGYNSVRILVRVGAVPLGEISCRPARSRAIKPDRLRRRIARQLTAAIATALLRDGMNAPAGVMATISNACADIENQVLSPTGITSELRESIAQSQRRQSWPMRGVTVAVCTRDRGDSLAACIEHLKSLDYPNYEILIVDASRDSVPTRELAERQRVTYVRLHSNSLARARNAALEQARHEWVAFIDDDCAPESNWLKELIRPTQDSKCRCVTGAVLPASLENSAQIALDASDRRYAGTFQSRHFDRNDLAAPWMRGGGIRRIGSSANILVHRGFAERLGGFSDDLPGGGDTCDFLHRLLRTDHHIHYTPGAIVRQQRALTPKSLRQNIRATAAGIAAYHTRRLLKYRDRRSLAELAWRLPATKLRTLIQSFTGRSAFPLSVALDELTATLAAPSHYIAARGRRWWRHGWSAQPRTTHLPIPHNAIEMSPPTPVPAPPRKLVYPADAASKTTRAA